VAFGGCDVHVPHEPGVFVGCIVNFLLFEAGENKALPLWLAKIFRTLP